MSRRTIRQMEWATSAAETLRSTAHWDAASSMSIKGSVTSLWSCDANQWHTQACVALVRENGYDKAARLMMRVCCET